MDSSSQALRKQLVYLLCGGGAHAGFDDVISRFPAGVRGVKPEGTPHTAWQLLEHMRTAQWDILEFSRNPEHVSPEFPNGYWPGSEIPPDRTAWNRSVTSFKKDLISMTELVEDPSTDLFSPIPHGDGQNILREALLAADHNAYHLGQLVLLSRLFGEWK